MNYREDKTYKALEKIITDAGVAIKYKEIPDDPLYGSCHARSDQQGLCIEMPEDSEHFGDDMYYASYVLGHEMGHILSDLSDDDYMPRHYMTEAMCDYIGGCLTLLAEMTAGTEAERETLKRLGRI